MIIRKNARELANMRRAGQIVAQVLAELQEMVRPGITTQELDALAYRLITRNGAKPSFLGYRNYPASICTSVNEQVVHGIPGQRVLKEGDIISLDVGAIYQDYQGDAAITVGVGHISEEARQLIEATRGALEAGIAEVRPGKRLGDISAAIQEYAESRGYSVIREYTGHGIGRQMHEDPQVPNFGQRGFGVLLKPGMTFALEPMLTMGTWETRVLEDGWTVVTADGKLSAHFEHTVAVTEDEPEILTLL
ncbi:MAG: type I methionyl aminopeptidase [Chloroflexi bacterium]|nr:type I methionyl aminopeptidase [Chloroflexota bacterium]